MTLLIANWSFVFSDCHKAQFTSHVTRVDAVEHDDEDEYNIPEYTIFIYTFKTSENTIKDAYNVNWELKNWNRKVAESRLSTAHDIHIRLSHFAPMCQSHGTKLVVKQQLPSAVKSLILMNVMHAWIYIHTKQMTLDTSKIKTYRPSRF